MNEWLSGSFDEATQRRIQDLVTNDPKTLQDCFAKEIGFGTAGMRGIMDVGPNRINTYTIKRAALGLATYLKKQFSHPKVLIGFDSRKNSLAFAETTARVLAAQNIHVYLLSELRPTPLISFGVRHLHCSAAVMITASHNPPEYNGFKVYWKDGGQVVPPHDEGIMHEVHAITDLVNITLSSLTSPLIQRIGEELDSAYIRAISPLAYLKEQNHREGKQLQVIYTSLHGTGHTLCPQALFSWGFPSLHLVKSQCIPDATFPTVESPNPENPKTLSLGLQQMLEEGADLLLATDPDADRLAVAVSHKGQAVILSGNEIASLCASHVASFPMPERGCFVTTIVSTELLKAIASAHGRPCFEVLTGFKYIAEKIHEWETSSAGFQFLFGAEESLGYLLGTVVRDKDGILSSCLLAEIALNAKLKGKTLIDLLEEIYQKYGVYKEKQLSFDLEAKKIETLMKHLRSCPPEVISGREVEIIEDYETGIRILQRTSEQEKLTLPRSNVLLYRLSGGGKIVVRPSGTEPKIKVYLSFIAKSHEECSSQIDAVCKDFLSGYFTRR